jgi:hypothetical protein
MCTFKRSFIGGIFCAAFLGLPICNAQESEIILIEEDWELVLNEPDANTVSPQITFFTSPSVNVDDCYFQLQMNYAAEEGFSSGGFHVAAVNHEQIVDEARSANQTVLSKDGDIIRWTNVMGIIGANRVMFAIQNGHCQNWGNFGGIDYLVELKGHPKTDLSEYHPLQSLASVDIGFGANRVASLTLVEVRAYYPDGRVVTVAVNQQP